MKKLFLKISLILLPVIIGIAMLILWDPFHIFFDCKDYYKDNVVEPNRSFVLTKTYLKYRKEYKFDSFIFGSSRSHAFRCVEWKKIIDSTFVPFHFDGASETLFGINKKVKFLYEKGDTIRNAIVVCDISTLTNTKNKTDHLHILPPVLSKESSLRFYLEFLKSSCSFEFLYAYLDYNLSHHKKKDYQRQILSLDDYLSYHNPVNGDYFYGTEQPILKDSLAYYKLMTDKGVFIRTNSKQKSHKITDEEEIQLKEIADVFEKFKTNYKIVISPLYDQIPMEKEHLNLLKSIFGEKNVFDFSGKNSITDSIGNYYENSHYKPFIANRIMKELYERDK